MTVKIIWNGKPYGQITKKNAIVFGISLMNKSKEYCIDPDALRCESKFVHLPISLPNERFAELLLPEIDEETALQFHGLENLHMSFEGIEMISEL